MKLSQVKKSFFAMPYYFFLSLAAVFVVMIGVGFFAGKKLSVAHAFNQFRVTALFSVSTHDIRGISRFITSEDPLLRIAGYYSIVDTHVYQREALLDDYSRESSDLVKKAIIYVLFIHEKERVTETLKTLLKMEKSNNVIAYIEMLLMQGKNREIVEARITL